MEERIISGFPEEQFDRQKLFHIRQNIQKDLIEHSSFQAQNINQKAMAWIKTYAEDYKYAFDSFIAAHPTIIAEYEDRPEEIIDEIKSQLEQIHYLHEDIQFKIIQLDHMNMTVTVDQRDQWLKAYEKKFKHLFESLIQPESPVLGDFFRGYTSLYEVYQENPELVIDTLHAWLVKPQAQNLAA